MFESLPNRSDTGVSLELMLDVENAFFGVNMIENHLSLSIFDRCFFF